MRPRFLSSILVVLAIAAITACGGSSSKTVQAITVSVSPTSPSIAGGANEQFTATVANTSNTGVTWSVTGGGTINVSGLYTAPASVPTQAIVTVTATSQADSTKTGIATVTLEADSVSVSPTSGQIPAAGTEQFTAKVNNLNSAVTWSLTAGPGSINSTGLYTAPNAVSAQTSITVTAILTVDSAAVGSTMATLLPDSVSVSAVNPTVLPGQTDQFNAAVNNSALTSVTWTVTGPGTVDTNGLYTAPASVPSPVQPQVKATLVSDPTQSSSATVAVLMLQSLTVAPKGPTLDVGASEPFTATGTFTNGTSLSTSDWTPESTWTSSNSAVATVAGSTASAIATGVSTITATYAPSGVTPVAGTTALNVTAGTLSNASLTGSYVFSLTHAGTRGQAFSAGVFQADGAGNITGGVVDYNAPQGSAKGVAISSGSYTVNADGRGTMSISAQGTDTYSFILSTDGSHGRIILSDPSGVEVGNFVQQTATTLGTGTYSLLLGGMDGTTSGSTATQNPEVLAGQFTVSASAITNAEFDVNDFGVINGGATCGTPCTPPATALSFSANFAQPIANGRGTLTITPTGLPLSQLNSGSWNFDYFVVSTSKIVLIQTDVQGTAPTFAALAGTAELQTFTSGPTLTANNFVVLLERSASQGLFGTAGQWAFSTTTQLNGEMDANCLTTGCPDTTSTVSIAGSAYTIDATGRGTVTVGTLRSYVFYMIGDPSSDTARMYILETDNKSNGGAGQQQSTTTTAPTGTLAFNLAQLATGGSDASFLGQYDTPSLSGIVDSNVAINSVATPGSSVITGTAFGTPDASGRGTVSLSGLPNQTNTSYGFYLVSPTQMVVFGTPATPPSGAYQAVDGVVEIQ
jgi:hypothetical protein